MNVLMVDVGGTNVKVMARHDGEMRKVPSGKTLTASEMVRAVLELAKGMEFYRISLGYPGLVENGEPALEPGNLGAGWVGFDYSRAFGKPVRCINDAAMQALANYRSGRLLYLGLGTGVGATVIVDDVVVPIDVGLIGLTRKGCLMDCLSKVALKRDGRERWREAVAEPVELLQSVFKPNQTVIGGGNAQFVGSLPDDCRCADNRSAYAGARRLWEGSDLYARAAMSSWRIHRDEQCLSEPGYGGPMPE